MKWRHLIVAALLAYIAYVVVRAFLPEIWVGSLATPATVPAQTVTFHCGAVWGAAHIRGPAKTPYPIVGTPCGDRTTLLTLSIIDILIAASGIVGVFVWRWKTRDHRASAGREVAGVARVEVPT